MLPTRQQTRKHLTEGAMPRRGVLSEAVDTHQAAVLTEAKKNEVVNRWGKVLGKCREVPQRKFGMMAQILENQFKHWNPKERSIILEDQTTTANIADFTRFALPLIRKSYPKLVHVVESCLFAVDVEPRHVAASVGSLFVLVHDAKVVRVEPEFDQLGVGQFLVLVVAEADDFAFGGVRAGVQCVELVAEFLVH